MPRIAVAGLFVVLSIPLLGQNENPVSMWATYIGGIGEDYARRAAMDAQGNMYVAGTTHSRNLHPALDTQGFGQLDFVMQILASGQPGWAVPLGKLPHSGAVAAAPDGTVYAFFENRLSIVDRNGARIGEVTLPTGGELAVDPRGGVIAATGDLSPPGISDVPTSGGIRLTRIDRDGSVRYAHSVPISGGLAGIAVDAGGNVYVTGAVSGDKVPTTASSFQPRYRVSQCMTPPGARYPCADAYVVKFDPNGELVYGTYFGGSGDDLPKRIVVDATGSAIIGGLTNSRDLPLQHALQSPCESTATSLACPDMFVAKFDPSGRSLIFSTFLGKSGGSNTPLSLAVDATGLVVVAATVSGNDLPVHRAAQDTNGAGPSFSSVDGGRTWRPSRMVANEVRQFAWTPTGARVFAATDRGVFWSSDSGQTWTGTQDVPTGDIRGLAVDPRALSTVYAASFGGGVFKTTDGGRTWTAVNAGLSSAGSNGLQLRAIAVAPSPSSTVYAAGPAGMFRSSDGAASWIRASGSFTSVTALAVDPSAPLTVWGAGGDVFKSIDGGATLAGLGYVPSFPLSWNLRDANSIVIDRTDPNTVYVGRYGGIMRTRDGGASWLPFTTGLPRLDSEWFTISGDPAAPDRLYASRLDGLYRASTVGALWEPFAVTLSLPRPWTRTDGRPRTEIAARGAAVLIGTAATSPDVYVAAIGPTGTLRWSTFAGGTEWESALGVGVRGRTVYLAGTTLSRHWPLAEAGGRPLAGGTDMFLARITDGSVLRFVD